MKPTIQVFGMTSDSFWLWLAVSAVLHVATGEEENLIKE
jgi:hypothetical protein